MNFLHELEAKVADINEVFAINKIAALKPDNAYIKKYYKINKIPYSLFHTKTDLIYMGISRDGEFKDEDLLGQAKFIEEYIRSTKAESVLEVATGRGANSFYLAQKFPEVEFYGIDFSETQLNLAKKKAQLVKNYFPEFGDYHNLSRYKSESFDLVFEVEALCYSIKKEIVLAQINRILKKGGIFIVFDGYLNKTENELTHVEATARALVEKGMALSEFESYRSFIDKVKTAGLEIVREENLSEAVLPTMYRFEKLAAKFFKHKFLTRILKIILPKEFLYNAIAGYLLPTVMKAGIACYMLTVIKKAWDTHR